MRSVIVDRGPPTAGGCHPIEQRPAVVGPWSVERPSLEYQHAFDLCAVEVHRAKEPVVVFASSPFYARELLRRLGGCEPMFLPVGDWMLSVASAQSALGPEVAWEHLGGGEEAREPVVVPVAVWAEPEQKNGERVLWQIDQRLSPGGRLFVIVTGPLARIQPVHQMDGNQPADSAAGVNRVTRWIRQKKLALIALYGLYGPESFLWGILAKLALYLRRPDLADCCYFKMRERLVVTGWQARWSTLILLVARKRV